MWESERAFARHVTGRMSEEGLRCVRLETGGTAGGVPDVYADGGGWDFWVELKNRKAVTVAEVLDKKCLCPGWRPSQGAWALDYLNGHVRTMPCCAGGKMKYYRDARNVVTLVGLKDGVAVAEMTDGTGLSERRACLRDTLTVYTMEDWGQVLLRDLLRLHTCMLWPVCEPGMTGFRYASDAFELYRMQVYRRPDITGRPFMREDAPEDVRWILDGSMDGDQLFRDRGPEDRKALDRSVREAAARVCRLRV